QDVSGPRFDRDADRRVAFELEADRPRVAPDLEETERLVERERSVGSGRTTEIVGRAHRPVVLPLGRGRAVRVGAVPGHAIDARLLLARVELADGPVGCDELRTHRRWTNELVRERLTVADAVAVRRQCRGGRRRVNARVADDERFADGALPGWIGGPVEHAPVERDRRRAAGVERETGD